MNPHTDINQDVYSQRMKHVKDKEMIIDLLNPQEGLIIDYGCGNGALAAYIDPTNYIGIDSSPGMVAQARQEHPRHTFSSQSITEMHIGKPIASIIASSVLHEVYSYSPHKLNKVKTLLRTLREVGDDETHLIIRDGILPHDARQTTSCFEVIDPDDAKDALFVIQNAGTISHDVKLVRHDDGSSWIEGPTHEIITFLNIYTWGWSSMPREKNECVNFLTESDYFALAEECGYEIIKSKTIIQNEYFDHLSSIIYIDEDVTWPTKFLAVLKPKNG